MNFGSAADLAAAVATDPTPSFFIPTSGHEEAFTGAPEPLGAAAPQLPPAPPAAAPPTAAAAAAAPVVAAAAPAVLVEAAAAPAAAADADVTEQPADGPPDGEPDGAPPPPAAVAAAPAGGGGGGAKRVAGGRGGPINLRTLVEEGVLEPGVDVLTVEYKGLQQAGSLERDGRITAHFGGRRMSFDSPSAFSIYVKRLVNPSRKADDGWKTIKYRGRTLELFKADLAAARAGDAPAAAAAAAAAPLPPRAAKRVRPADPAPPPFDFSAAAAADGADGARPQRRRRAPPRFAALGADDEHALRPMEAYAPGPPGAPGAAPFSLHVAPAAEVMMDFHAHLCTDEVIGLLAGTWDPAARRITVLRAHPVRELATADGSVDVEMDPEAEFAARQEIGARAGERVVGWYHSHPTFAALPSRIDIYNQAVQQRAHRDDGGAEPYVAAIVSPYDRRAPTTQSALAWFYVDHAPGAALGEGQPPEAAGFVPKALAPQPLYGDAGGDAALALAPAAELQPLAKRYAPLPEAADLGAPWRDGGNRANKLVASLQSRLPPTWAEAAVEDFGTRTYVAVMAVWSVYSAAAQRARHAQVQAHAAAQAQAHAQWRPAPGGPGEETEDEDTEEE